MVCKNRGIYGFLCTSWVLITLGYLVRARIIEERIMNRIDSNRLFFMNRLEVSYDRPENESPRRHL